MNPDVRPSPDDLLKAIHEEELESKKGKLKIFIGMAAGVGKTYAMLQEAQVLKQEGVDLVVGCINTHGREETAKLLHGLEVIPEKLISYRGMNFHELDIDTILKRSPGLVLIDELAHENIPGSKHLKRWQDVSELLASGMDVYTTLNVQHIESLNDIIYEVTGISVRETVPDQIIEIATSIRLVDLTPDELLERLAEGKVYLGDQSKLAIEHFFQKDRLTALRELVLRYAADKIDRDLRKMAPKKSGPFDWTPREKFLVCVSHSPHSQKGIRYAKRRALLVNAPWIALHVDSGLTLSEKQVDQLSKNILLAQNLGAEVMTVYDNNVAEAIHRCASDRGVTQIIMGRSPKSSIFPFLRSMSLFHKLANMSTDIDIHVVKIEKWRTAKGMIGIPIPRKAFFTFIPAIILSLLMVASLTLNYNYDGEQKPLFLALFLFTLLWTGILTLQLKRQKESLQKSEKRTMTLYEINKNLAENHPIDSTLTLAEELLQKFHEGIYRFKVKQPANGIKIELGETLLAGEKERNAAIWSFENRQEAGWSTEILPDTKNLYIPLMGVNEVMGLLIYHPTTAISMSLGERTFLHTICQQIGAFLERRSSQEREREHAALERMEQMHKMLLNRLSHAFETPISSTKKALEEVKKRGDVAHLQKVEESFELFLNIVENISAMAQLSEGMIPLRKNLSNLEELIQECCKNLSRHLENRTFEIMVEPSITPFLFDYYLIQILLHNLLLNALENSPEFSAINIDAKAIDQWIEVTIKNRGSPIPEDQLETIFDIFYRLPHDKNNEKAQKSKNGGIGIGLTIARTIAELHGGTLTAQNLLEGSTCFILRLPV